MHFVLNGQKITYQGDLNITLLEYLREQAGITSVKDGCSHQGACGACTVEINSKAVLSCTTPLKKIIGKEIVTVDGYEQEIQDAFAHAFVKMGGVQCGFCIPGIVVRARNLLRENLNPTANEIKKAIRPHICRCTGYKKIIESILFAASILRGDKKFEESDIIHEGGVGKSLEKYEAHELVLGKKSFVCDMKTEDCYYSVLKFSDHPRAIVKSIDVSGAEQLDGVIRVITAKDIPGKRVIGIIEQDWHLMIDEGECTRYIGDVLANVVATNEKVARQAVELIKVEYEVLRPISTVDDALRMNNGLVHPEREIKSNILSESNLYLGDPEEALKEAAFITEGTFYTQRVEHAFLEVESCFVIPEVIDDETHYTVFSQGQGVYEDRKQLMKILNLPKKKINVVQVSNGGAFGGKEDLSVQGHATLAAYVTGHPIKLTLTRPESLCFHPKRHPMRMHLTLGCDIEGTLTVLRAKIDGDTGAYASVGMKVLERAAGHATGGYQVLNIDLSSRAIYTNNVPCGAMRGFGVNQITFALESCIDELCEKGDFDRFEFRLKNCLDKGKKTATGQVLGEGVGLKDCLLALKNKFYEAPYSGIALGIKNTGIGNGMADTAQAKIVIKAADHIVIHHGWTEMGQGVHTMAIQTVAEETGLSPDIFEVIVETDSEAVCGMTTSSRGTSLVGNSLIDACKKLCSDLEKKMLSELVGNTYFGEWICDWTTDSFCEYPKMPAITHYSYGYAAQLVTLNERGNIEKVYAAHDAGRVMNPTLFEGQIEGAVHMGLGQALKENFPMKDGKPLSIHFGRLGILRSTETPDVEVIAIEAGDEHGPYGAKGVGEIGLVPTAAALSNALYKLDGVRRYSLPIGYKKVKREG